MTELTPKQRRFAEEYIVDLNATAAAIRAGYAKSGAHVEGARMLKHTKVKRLIDELRAERSAKTKIDAAWLLERLASEATADVGDLYDDDGNLLPVKQWPLIWRQGLVAGIDVEEIKDEGCVVSVVRKIKVSDRVKRLELIGKHIGVRAFEENIRVTGLEGLSDRLARASKRVDDDDAAE